MSAAKVTIFPRRDPPTILVIEDDVLTRCLISDELRPRGFKVLEVGSAEDALTVLNAVRADLVFVDIYLMGSCDGLDVARFVRAQPQPAQVIITSGKAAASSIHDLHELGPFVPKPYPASQVADLIMRSLNWPRTPNA